MKYNVFVFFYLFIYTLFSETRAQVRPVDGFLHTQQIKNVKSCKDVLFGGLNDVPLHFAGKTPPKLKFWEREIGLSSLNDKIIQILIT